MKFPWLLVLISYLAFPLITAASPNVVVFLTDDQGWGDLSIHGNRNLATPHIDSIGEKGALFENFYVCAVCAPTRAEFLTARYFPKTGVSGVSTGEGRINPDETTIADIFKAAGYATGAFGKWHNGTQSPYHPNDRGFDEFYGFTSGHWGAYFSPPLDHNKTKVKGNGYVIDDFTDHAIRFIEENKDEPFFCYVPYNTPHSPMIIDDEWFDKFAEANPEMKFNDESKEDLNMTRAALAMVENIDWNVGRVLETLRKHDLEEDTIVLFFSDNGPNSFRWNGGMKGRKGTIDEGGLRSPFLIQWPKGIKAGSVINQVTSGLDLLPTLAELAGIEVETAKPIDGRSFAALLNNPNAAWPSRNLFNMWRSRISIRTDRFRLDNDGALFDIIEDRGQTTNVADQYPELVDELSKAAASFSEEMHEYYEQFAERPFAVGFDRSTTLPARDGVQEGPSITRSSKAPNNSFFENWKSTEDSITFSVDVAADGAFDAIVYYTCREGDLGATIRLSEEGGDHTEAKVVEAFDPPFYDNSKERMENSHYIVKDFTPLRLGSLTLRKGHQTLRLTAPEIVGDEAIDVHSVELVVKE
ncbi:MAG: arylsulfatase [Verrucomicrobiota bacterium]